MKQRLEHGWNSEIHLSNNTRKIQYKKNEISLEGIKEGKAGSKTNFHNYLEEDYLAPPRL